VTFRDPGIWSVRVGTDFLKHSSGGPLGGIQQYTVNLGYHINEAFEILANFNYDTRRGDFSQQSFGLRQNIRNLWFIEYLLRFNSGDTRAGSTSVSVSVELASF
jgi:hypothetical protein